MLSGITRIPAVPAGVSGLVGVVAVFFCSLFLVFGLYLFLRVSVRRRELVLVIAK